MTDKQRLIIDYLTDHNGQGFYFDIRDSMALQFDDEDDFDKDNNYRGNSKYTINIKRK